ncbi:hypothetical protein AQUSIP_15690 [Aquicella siphonis]|uniref:Uncharacterized protein n=2 Tax=Aquicella siphonis TaxID=254247 RepID=A0A5E4PGT5_9COXI|nr:hypothetical protein AQUSIP_15690 [Aquicella siphonis]
MSSTAEPNKVNLDTQYGDKLPMLIKNDNNIWIYGLNVDGDTKLTKSNSPDKYNSLIFTESLTQLQEVSEDIYVDIRSCDAHISTMYVGTNAVVVRNSGRLSARNVRLGHKTLPNYNIYPNTKYEVTSLPSGGKEIIFPILVPGEQITISYLYFAPTTYSEINTYVKSDEGLAGVIDVIPAPSIAAWLKYLLYVLLFVGLLTVIYLGIILIVSIFRRFHCV